MGVFLSVEQYRDLARSMRSLEGERDRWRKRALEAETRLAFLEPGMNDLTKASVRAEEGPNSGDRPPIRVRSHPKPGEMIFLPPGMTPQDYAARYSQPTLDDLWGGLP